MTANEKIINADQSVRWALMQICMKLETPDHLESCAYDILYAKKALERMEDALNEAIAERDTRHSTLATLEQSDNG